MSTSKKYPTEFKDQLIERYLAGGQSFKALAKEAGVSRDALSDWVKAHNKANAPAKQTTSAEQTPPAQAAIKPQKTKASNAKSAQKKTSKPAASQPKEQAATRQSNEIESLRKALQEALEEKDLLKRVLRIFAASD